MKCLMFGLACDQEQFDKYIERNKSPYSVAHYIFEKKLIEELEKNFQLEHNYILQEKNSSLQKSMIKKKRRKVTEDTYTTYLNYINLPVIKFLTLFISTIIRVLKYNYKNKDEFYVLSTINYFPVAAGLTIITKLLRKKNVIIFTDCSVGYAYDKNSRKSLKILAMRIYKKILNFIENNYDAYILFSEPMNELVNQKKKPYCVMEGFFNSDNISLENVKKYEKFIIMYAGTIIESVGLQNLVKAIQMTDLDLEVWIYGEGDYKNELMRLCSKDSRIKFFGFIDRKELFELEKKVSLLVNVRDPRLEYTKYSFPSKSFEYMASGTPFLSTRLLCYPKEYDQYIYFISESSVEIIKNKIEEIYYKTVNERETFGENAKRFVLNSKNPKIQTKKVSDFINKEMNKRK